MEIFEKNSIDQMEPKFVALHKANETEWFQNLVEDILIWKKLVLALGVHCDSSDTEFCV